MNKLLPLVVVFKILVVSIFVSASFWILYVIYTGLDLLDKFSGSGVEGLRALGLPEGEISRYFENGGKQQSLLDKIPYIFDYPLDEWWYEYFYFFVLNLGLIFIATTIFYIWNERKRTI